MEVVSTTGMGVWDSRSKISNTLDVGKEASIFTACYRQPDRTNFAQTVLQRTKMFLENNVPPLEADRANTMSFEFFKFHMCWQPQILQQHDGRFAVRGQKHVPKRCLATSYESHVVSKHCPLTFQFVYAGKFDD